MGYVRKFGGKKKEKKTKVKVTKNQLKTPLARELFHASSSDSKVLSLKEDVSSDLVSSELFIQSPRSPKRCSIQDLRASSSSKKPRIQEHQDVVVNIFKDDDAFEV